MKTYMCRRAATFAAPNLIAMGAAGLSKAEASFPDLSPRPASALSAHHESSLRIANCVGGRARGRRRSPARQPHGPGTSDLADWSDGIARLRTETSHSALASNTSLRWQAAIRARGCGRSKGADHLGELSSVAAVHRESNANGRVAPVVLEGGATNLVQSTRLLTSADINLKASAVDVFAAAALPSCVGSTVAALGAACTGAPSRVLRVFGPTDPPRAENAKGALPQLDSHGASVDG